jgi:MYXO-CTERM domain-containing protein
MNGARTWLFLLTLGVATLAGGTASAYSVNQVINQTSSGQNMTFTFSNLPFLQTGSVSVVVYVYGDYNSQNEFAAVTIDGAAQTAIPGRKDGESPDCNASITSETTGVYTVAASTISDHQLVVNVDLSSYVTYTTCQAYNPRVSVWVSYTAYPDLIVPAPSSITGSTAGAGSAFTVNYNLRNLYQSFTNDFAVQFHYCPTNGPTGCVLLGTQNITDNFNADQTRSYTSQTLTLPTSVERGTRYIRIYADALNDVSENSGTNNYRYQQISVTDYPDLYISSSIVPYTGNTTGPGATFTGRYCIRNDANKSAVYNSFVVRYWYCPNNNATGCTQIGQQTITADIMSGGLYCYTSITLTLPSTVTGGTHYIRAMVDATQTVAEDDGTNNNDYDSIYIGTGTLPDLTADNLTVPLSGTVSGAGSTFTMQSRIVNNTTAAFTTNFSLGYYYCVTQATTQCTQIGTQTVTQNFAGNGTLFVTSPTLTIPNTAVYGNAYIRVFVDRLDSVSESNESNNNAYGGITITKQPDLTVAGTAPKTGTTDGPGDTFTAELTVTNAASTSAFSTNFDVQYEYCPAQAATNCVVLGKDSITNDFDSGETHTYTSTQLTMPGAATPGTRYLRVFVDSGTAVAEGNESNNVTYIPITVTKGAPDFYVNSFTATVNGTNVTYNIEVCNKGEATTDTFSLALFYDAASAPTCADTADQSANVTGLAKNACKTQVFVQAGAPVGSATAWVMADQACGVGESDESNNTASASVNVVPLPDAGPPPDGPPPQEDGGVGPDAFPPDQGIPDDVGTPDAGPTPDIGPQPDGPEVQEDGPPVQEDGPPVQIDGPPVQEDSGVTQYDTGGTTGGDAKTTPPSSGDDGCSCRVDSGARTPAFIWLLLGLLLVGLRFRRRR